MCKYSLPPNRKHKISRWRPSNFKMHVSSLPDELSLTFHLLYLSCRDPLFHRNSLVGSVLDILVHVNIRWIQTWQKRYSNKMSSSFFQAEITTIFRCPKIFRGDFCFPSYFTQIYPPWCEISEWYAVCEKCLLETRSYISRCSLHLWGREHDQVGGS